MRKVKSMTPKLARSLRPLPLKDMTVFENIHKLFLGATVLSGYDEVLTHLYDNTASPILVTGNRNALKEYFKALREEALYPLTYKELYSHYEYVDALTGRRRPVTRDLMSNYIWVGNYTHMGLRALFPPKP